MKHKINTITKLETYITDRVCTHANSWYDTVKECASDLLHILREKSDAYKTYAYYDKIFKYLNHDEMEQLFLNGATDWLSYSTNGNGLVYTQDIKCRFQVRNNENELVVQALAFNEAFELIYYVVNNIIRSYLVMDYPLLDVHTTYTVNNVVLNNDTEESEESKLYSLRTCLGQMLYNDTSDLDKSMQVATVIAKRLMSTEQLGNIQILNKSISYHATLSILRNFKILSEQEFTKQYEHRSFLIFNGANTSTFKDNISKQITMNSVPFFSTEHVQWTFTKFNDETIFLVWDYSANKYTVDISVLFDVITEMFNKERALGRINWRDVVIDGVVDDIIDKLTNSNNADYDTVFSDVDIDNAINTYEAFHKNDFIQQYEDDLKLYFKDDLAKISVENKELATHYDPENASDNKYLAMLTDLTQNQLACFATFELGWNCFIPPTHVGSLCDSEYIIRIK